MAEDPLTGSSPPSLMPFPHPGVTESKPSYQWLSKRGLQQETPRKSQDARKLLLDLGTAAVSRQPAEHVHFLSVYSRSV